MDYYVCNKQYGSLKSSKITTCFAKRAKLQKQDPTKDVGGVLDTRSAKKNTVKKGCNYIKLGRNKTAKACVHLHITEETL